MPIFKTNEELEHLIRSFYVLDSFDKERITQISALIADPANTICNLTSKSFTDDQLPNKEKWYKIDYSSQKYSEEQLKLMLNPQVKQNGKSLDLPPANNLIPKNFDVHPEQPEQSKRPVFAAQWDNADLWYKKDDKFKKPKGKVAVKIYTNDIHFGTTATSRVFAEMWKACFNEYIREFKYIADCAELTSSITLAVDNLQFEWSGYTDTLSIYVQETL